MNPPPITFHDVRKMLVPIKRPPSPGLTQPNDNKEQLLDFLLDVFFSLFVQHPKTSSLTE